MRKAVDVSSYKGMIDWQAVKAAGIVHAVLRSVVKDGSADQRFAENAAGCKKAGMPFDIYKYSYALSEEESRKEAELVMKLLEKHDCPKTTCIWWDMEYDRQKALKRTSLMRILAVAKEEAEKAGYPFGVYCNKDWYENVLDSASLDCPVWLARYPSSQEMELSDNPDERYKPTFVSQVLWGWQYTSAGKVPGITGRVDLNILYGEPGNTGEAPTEDYEQETAAQEDRHEAVRSLQEALNYDGYRDAEGNKLILDGLIGKRTKQALGKVALRAGEWTGSHYRVGSAGAAVLWLQMRLNTVLGSGLDTDGKYGSDTREAVGKWQEKQRLTKDYIAGIQTILSMVQ